MAAYDEAVASLYQAPFADFTAERKRLAVALKAAGDKDGAARLAKLPRPPASAWAVNQLWWKHRGELEELLAAAARVKAGEREAAKVHRERLAHLSKVAARVLQEAGNSAAEATLRRVTATLSAVAAQGGFAPDPPGALTADRDPPGFEALGSSSPASERPTLRVDERSRADEAQRRLAGERARAEEAERARAEEAERKRRIAERARLSQEQVDAQKLAASQRAEIARLQRELLHAEQSLSETEALLERLEGELSSL